MRYLEVAGVRVSKIGLGCWQFGAREWGYGADLERQVGAIVKRALDLGVNLLDTAEIYSFGRSERLVGEAIRGRRGECFVATKIAPVLPTAGITEWRARGSARRLGVERIDLYQVHAPNPLVPYGWTMEGMRRLQGSGLVAHVGVSNYSLSQWRRAETELGAPVLSNQVRFSLVAREPDRDLVPYAVNYDRLLIAYSPLGQGLLSGRYDGSVTPSGIVRRRNPLFGSEAGRLAALVGALREIAQREGATPAQVALAWVIRRPNTVAIPGASRPEQVEQNAAAADLDLSEEDDQRLVAAASAIG